MWQVIGQLRVICGYIQKLPYRCISKCKASPILRRVGDLGVGNNQTYFYESKTTLLQAVE